MVIEVLALSSSNGAMEAEDGRSMGYVVGELADVTELELLELERELAKAESFDFGFFTSLLTSDFGRCDGSSRGAAVAARIVETEDFDLCFWASDRKLGLEGTGGASAEGLVAIWGSPAVS